jgi:hypothetical protein
MMSVSPKIHLFCVFIDDGCDSFFQVNLVKKRFTQRSQIILYTNSYAFSRCRRSRQSGMAVSRRA